jgi:hypothetical protein
VSRSAAGCLLGLAVLVLLHGWVPAAGASPAATGRVLVISVPGLRWADLDRPELATVR